MISRRNRAAAPSRRSRHHRLLAFLFALAVAAGLVVVAPAPVSAEMFHPRQEWLRNGTGGLFLHWGMRTAPQHTNCAEWEKAVTDGGWEARHWIDEAIKLKAEYVVLATFHSRLGYARAWPSKIPGTCSPKRDFLGETIAAAKRRNVRVLLYMTDDPKWWWEGLPEGQSWMDSAAYSAHKGRPVDLHTRDGFGEFSYENFFEIIRNYPGLSGLWIDNDNNYWERNGLYEQVRRIRPNWLLTNNGSDKAIFDAVSTEQKTGMTPAYDYPQAALTPQPRLTEACYKLPTEGPWWYGGVDEPVDRMLTLGRFITNAGSSIKSLQAETPMKNGKMPPKQLEYNNFASSYLHGIWESISDTEGGGYLHGGMQPGRWNDGAHGVITVKKRRPNLQYLHVLTKPATANFLQIRDAGYKVRKVTQLRTGKTMRFTQGFGYLTIEGIADWDPYDTVFKVETDGRRGFLPQARLQATVSSAKVGLPGFHLFDGSFENYWDSNLKVPVTIDVDLGGSTPVASLAINQREWSPTYPRASFGKPEDSARIKDYTVSVSSDGVSWTPVKTAVLPSSRGVQFIDVNVPATRHVRLSVQSIWAGPQAPSFVNKLGIDEMFVTSGYVTSAVRAKGRFHITG
jgi:hypothetical protein